MRESIRDFLRDFVDGLEELETLVALAERRDSRVAELAGVTRLQPGEVLRVVERLSGRGLLSLRDGVVCLASEDPRLGELVALYRGDPVVVLRVLNSLAIERVRLGATRAFSDAFLIRRNKPDG